MSAPIENTRFDSMADSIDGVVSFDGVPYADIVAKKSDFAVIYGWAGDGTGRSPQALQVLKEYASPGPLVVEDPGDIGTKSRSYWDAMYGRGLIDEMVNSEGDPIHH